MHSASTTNNIWRDMTTIMKTTITFTVLHPSDVTFSNLSDALYEADDGLAVGWETGYTTVRVPDDQVRDELITLNNDGTFFDDVDDDDVDDD